MGHRSSLTVGDWAFVPDRPVSPVRQVRAARPLVVLASASALLLAACGGGGSGGGAKPVPPAAPAGITGRILAEGLDFGRVIEQEPNDGPGRAHRLPPLAARSMLEVTGTLGRTPQVFGAVDAADVFRLETLAPQDVTVRLSYDTVDPAGGPGNDLQVDVVDPATGDFVAQALAGPPPRLTAFAAEAGRVYEVVIRGESGHAPYTVAFLLAEPSAPPAPSKAVEPEPEPGPVAPVVLPDEGLPCAGTHVLVRLRANGRAEALAGRFGLRIGRRLASGTRRLRFPAALEGAIHEKVAAWCKRLEADPDVAWAEPDWLVKPLSMPDDPELPRQWNLGVIGAPAAWEITRGDPSVVVGIVDSGIVSHPDLEGQVQPGYDFISDPAIAGDGDGRDADPTDEGAMEDPSGLSVWHGTHLAGIVAARADDGHGICGVAPACRVMPLRAVGRTGGLSSDVADAILFAAGLFRTTEGFQLSTPLPVVNLSFGVAVDSLELGDACHRASNAGVFLVGATGNDGGGVLYPAKYSTVFAVGAVDAHRDTTSYSNFGDEVDLCAPGGRMVEDCAGDAWPDAILSCVLDETLYPRVPSHGYQQGTSQSAPHVAAAAALLLSVDRDLTPAEIRNHLAATALDRGEPGKDPVYGYGVLQTHRALRSLVEALGQPLTTPPELYLPCATAVFPGFEESVELPVANQGGGTLELGDPTCQADDGGDWLSAGLHRLAGPVPVNARYVIVDVDRRELPGGPGRYGGTVFVKDASGNVLDRIRVVAFVDQRLSAGMDYTVAARNAAGSMGVRAFGVASACFGYRYWFPKLASGRLKIQAGEDLDGNGFFCEEDEACSWHGGDSQSEATVVEPNGSEALRDVDVILGRP